MAPGTPKPVAPYDLPHRLPDEVPAEDFEILLESEDGVSGEQLLAWLESGTPWPGASR